MPSVAAPAAIPGFASGIEFRNPHKLTAYARNSREHSDEQILQVVRSIEKYGFNNPILIDQAGEIVAGHARHAAALTLALESVPCIVLQHLTPTQRRAYLIADNKIALNAKWSEELLQAELEDLLELGYEIEDMGFDEMPDFAEGVDEDLEEELNESGEGFDDVKRAIQIELDPEDYPKAYEACAAMRKAGMNVGRAVLPAILEAARLAE